MFKIITAEEARLASFDNSDLIEKIQNEILYSTTMGLFTTTLYLKDENEFKYAETVGVVLNRMGYMVKFKKESLNMTICWY